MSGLGRAVRRDEHPADGRVDARRRERGRARDEAVEEYRRPVRRAAEGEPGEEHELEASERRQRIGTAVRPERAPHGLDLARDAGLVEARAATAGERVI